MFVPREARGRCVCHPQESDRPPAKHLLLVNSLGPSKERLCQVEANVDVLFSGGAGGDWDCLVAVYASEEDLPDQKLAKIMQTCSIFRAPMRWGEFLASLKPVVVRRPRREINHEITESFVERRRRPGPPNAAGPALRQGRDPPRRRLRPRGRAPPHGLYDEDHGPQRPRRATPARDDASVVFSFSPRTS